MNPGPLCRVRPAGAVVPLPALPAGGGTYLLMAGALFRLFPYLLTWRKCTTAYLVTKNCNPEILLAQVFLIPNGGDGGGPFPVS